METLETLERVILTGIENSLYPESIQELEGLVYTAGGRVTGSFLQRKQSPDPAWYIGKGKAEEIAAAVREQQADLVVFDNELSAVQVRNLEQILSVRVIDRTMLILDIFAQRALSREGKLQVELAQLKHLLPRLSGMGVSLSRLGGGIGTRGPGEKKIETDRRHIRRRIQSIENQLKLVVRRRNILRESRKRADLPVVAVVGYTNSGKTTLINTLCGSGLSAEDKLFATLDPAARATVMPGGKKVIFTDTVGFIQNLPHELVEAFQSTLEEVLHADVILHVADASVEDLPHRIRVVQEMLKQIGTNAPVILLYNKADRLETAERENGQNRRLLASAVTGEGIPELLEAVSLAIAKPMMEMELRVPYQDGWVEPWLRKHGEVLETRHLENAVYYRVRLEEKMIARVSGFRVSESPVSESPVSESRISTASQP